MRKWSVVSLLALGLVAPVFAQDLQTQLDELRKELVAVKAKNAEIEASLANSPADTTLEERVNALSESLDYAGTTVESVARPIRIFGTARTRSGWTFDRDFGQDFGNSDLEDDDGSFVDARFQMGFDFTLDRDVMVRMQLQSNGLYNNGDTPGAGSLGEVQMYEAFIQLGNIFGRKELGAREGRQEIVLGNEFQFGNNDFFSGETFDGSHWWWNAESWALHFLWAKMNIVDDFNARDWPYAPSGAGDAYDDDELYSLYFEYKGSQEFGLDIYWIYFNGHNGGSFGTLGNHLGSESTGNTTKGGPGFDFYYHTFGFRVHGLLNVAAGLDYNLELAYQTGGLADEPAGAIDDVEGIAIEGEVGITFSNESKFRLYIRGLYAEGGDGDDTGYIPLFPERHSQAGGDNGNRRARYGLMDIIPMDNVWSVQLGVHFDPAEAWTLGLTAIYAAHDEDVLTLAGTADDGIGFEIDAYGEYRYSAQTTLSGGIGVLFPDDGAPLKGGAFVGDDDSVAFVFYMQARVVF